jgi:hypothetical protein
MFHKFTESFSARIRGEGGDAPVDNSVSVTEVAGTVVKGMVGRMLGRKADEGSGS